ncbi:hypothetical protein NL676_023985 [Syzygium grande]|nr:hypothetical protein NL676_023985 [Syzygium grande]
MMTILSSARSLFSVLLLLCVIHFAAASTFLPDDEVVALREIATALGKTDWNFSVDPCSNEGEWSDKLPPGDTLKDVNCSCTTDANKKTVCHVIRIVLKSQSLPGTLPTRLFRLPFLQRFDVTRNYLSGTIPMEWGSTKLVHISLIGNRLTGMIPMELGNIYTLQILVVEFNRLSGPLPPDLGNLTQLNHL